MKHMATEYTMDLPKDLKYLPSSQSSNSTSFASVTLSDGTNYLFYYNPDKTLCCLAGKDPSSYSYSCIQVAGEAEIQAGHMSPLAATSWDWGGSKHADIRLYYVATGTNQIKELCSTDGKYWIHGQLNDQKFKIAPSGGLAASSYSKKSELWLKVFFADADNHGKIVVASITSTPGEWDRNVIE